MNSTYTIMVVEHILILVLVIFHINVQHDFQVIKIYTFLFESLDEVLLDIFLFLLLLFLIGNVQIEKKLFHHLDKTVYHLVLQIEFFNRFHLHRIIYDLKYFLLNFFRVFFQNNIPGVSF